MLTLNPSQWQKHKKVILITGCSSGFGLLIAARLASAGHSVIATMRNLTKQNDLLNELRKRNAQADILLNQIMSLSLQDR